MTKHSFKFLKLLLAIIVLIFLVFLLLKYVFNPTDHQYASRIISEKIPGNVELVYQYRSPASFNGDGTDFFVFLFDQESLSTFAGKLDWSNKLSEKAYFPEIELTIEECRFDENNNNIYYFHDRSSGKSKELGVKLSSNYDAAALDLDSGCLYIQKTDT